MELRSVYPISCEGPVFYLSPFGQLGLVAIRTILRDKSLLLWNNQGMLGLIPYDILANAAELYDNWGKISNRIPPPKIEIRWEQTIPIHQSTLEVLQKPEHTEKVPAKQPGTEDDTHKEPPKPI